MSMDPKALLDYALFQLTPTRTRCDLVVFSGKKNEKLASGLVEPFVAHLKYAKDQIPKGGYSITLRPPGTDKDASWFTKATFQRFVRFVSTPEILERIIRIEREILQIDDSSTEEAGHHVEAADGVMKKPINSSKLSSDEEVNGAELRENSRLRLQRLMDTRKALLQKEQAMAYARAVVAGYEMDTIDDLICFADTFGASRLREACIDFKELYKKKHSDDQWLNELAAVQASSMTDLSYMVTPGIMLAGENINGNGISPLVRSTSSEPSDFTNTTPNSDGSKENNLAGTEQTPNVQQQVPWMNQIPPYMYNFQGPIQQMPPYQGYPFPGMQPYYPGHVGWPAPGGNNTPSKKNHQNHKSSRRKEKSLDASESEEEDDEEQTASSDSYSGSDSDSKGKKYVKKSKKKKSPNKTVVIRNINYITSKRRNGDENEGSDDSSSGGGLSLDEASIKEGVDNALEALEKHSHSKLHKNRGKQGSNGLDDTISANISSDGGKTNSAWGAFENLLMSNEEPKHNNHPSDSMDEHSRNLDFESEKIKKQNLTMDDDSSLVIHRNGENGLKSHVANFTNGGDMNPSMKKIVSEDENALFSREFQESRTMGTLPDFSLESESTMKNRKGGEDWFVANSGSRKQENFTGQDTLSFETDFIRKETTKGGIAVVDDSFMIESRSDENYVSQWRTDINMAADIDIVNQPENGTGKTGSFEPDDLCMMVVRESRESGGSWTPEMDYQVEISFNEADKRSSIDNKAVAEEKPVENGKNGGTKKSVGPTTRKPLYSKSKPDLYSKTKKISPANRLMSQKSKLEKEEEDRKRLEEIRIERQKRIAERTAAAGKKLPVGNKTTPPKLLKK